MKSKLLFVGIAVIGLAALAFGGLVWAGTAYAQSQTSGYAYGMMGGQYEGYGMMGTGDYGPMHETMVDALAEALNLTPEEVQARIDAGETPWEIAQSLGLSDAQIQQLLLDAHDQALDQAVDAGLLTQEQADWMDQHMESMWSDDGAGFGGCHGPNGTGNSSSDTSFGPMMRWYNQTSE